MADWCCLSACLQVQAVLEAGSCPKSGCLLLDVALRQLEASNDYLQQHNRLAAVTSALQHTQTVFNRALEQCDADSERQPCVSAAKSMHAQQLLAALPYEHTHYW